MCVSARELLEQAMAQGLLLEDVSLDNADKWYDSSYHRQAVDVKVTEEVELRAKRDYSYELSSGAPYWSKPYDLHGYVFKNPAVRMALEALAYERAAERSRKLFA